MQLERQAHAEARRLLAAALERIPPQLEAPSEATLQPGRVDSQPAVESAQEPRESSEMHMQEGPVVVHYPATSRGPPHKLRGAGGSSGGKPRSLRDARAGKIGADPARQSGEADKLDATPASALHASIS